MRGPEVRRSHLLVALVIVLRRSLPSCIDVHVAVDPPAGSGCPAHLCVSTLELAFTITARSPSTSWRRRSVALSSWLPVHPGAPPPLRFFFVVVIRPRRAPLLVPARRVAGRGTVPALLCGGRFAFLRLLARPRPRRVVTLVHCPVAERTVACGAGRPSRSSRACAFLLFLRRAVEQVGSEPSSRHSAMGSIERTTRILAPCLASGSRPRSWTSSSVISTATRRASSTPTTGPPRSTPTSWPSRSSRSRATRPRISCSGRRSWPTPPSRWPRSRPAPAHRRGRRVPGAARRRCSGQRRRALRARRGPGRLPQASAAELRGVRRAAVLRPLDGRRAALHGRGAAGRAHGLRGRVERRPVRSSPRPRPVPRSS